VELTRREDKALSPSDRAATANRRDAACFVSLQAMGAGRPEAKGFEVFYPPTPPSGADPALWRAGQASVGAESRRLAEVLHRLLAERIPTYDRGVRELPSPLLSAVTSPAALVVTGNLSWPPEAELLTEPAGRARFAAALADAIDLFFSEGAAAQ
jgi:N-acetylmuramoyl-L-alanine amidase